LTGRHVREILVSDAVRETGRPVSVTVDRRRLSLALGLAAVGMMLTAQLADATHVRPQGATPLRVSLVPAYQQCTSANRTHGGPLSFPSCAPPTQSSSFLTVGTPDSNGAGANSVGSIHVRVIGTPPVVVTSLTISDVRCRPATNASICATANAAGGPDYHGEIQGNATIRITDHFNAVAAGGGPDAATVVDIPFPINAPCASTSNMSVGSTCSVTACSCDGPPRNDIGGKLTVVGITQFFVRDGGPDGIVATEDGSTVFLRQGIFVP
jgi:hypothetical protein